MNKFKVYSLTVLFSVLVFPSRAAAFAPPLATQVKEVAQWFTGLFDNAQQVENNPTVPLLTMSNCSVQVGDGNLFPNSQNVYLQQQSDVFERIRFYSFSEGDSVVNLSIRSFVNSDMLSGLCNQPEQQRIINISNIDSISCDLSLTWEQNRYIGTNAPNGCPTITGGKVVSNVTFFNNGVNSLDQIFTANGNLIVNTPIEFRRTASIPEPGLLLGILALGIWGNATALSGKIKHQSTQK
ncbi:chromophore lyase CpcT/CpeT [Nodularia sphaerocarpa]|uniref:chromophore lyase CpcT/CpeT n=1 Tax=Nodularia sphaerocarpa TaxID=137816 RepID=UPI0023304516|nr:chromophore lyase CpcT/CpeT [Nodularia sphaerocarpa]MDB9372341.1 chromophore lyase CpcT/CpeT [Nodularia sphaerocarpa CS-585]MDB9377957.1 chromophore lyase CpcT/CpeT [Nodularia sphaerocarpa CS-585A2]